MEIENLIGSKSKSGKYRLLIKFDPRICDPDQKYHVLSIVEYIDNECLDD